MNSPDSASSASTECISEWTELAEINQRRSELRGFSRERWKSGPANNARAVLARGEGCMKDKEEQSRVMSYGEVLVLMLKAHVFCRVRSPNQ